MDLNKAYAAHQRALMAAGMATDPQARRDRLADAARIATRIGSFQQDLGAAAAQAWMHTPCAAPAKLEAGPHSPAAR